MTSLSHSPRSRWISLAGCFLVLATGHALLAAPPASGAAIHGDNGITLPAPPTSAIIPVTDEMSGHAVEDPYRWLEDQKSPQTRAWIDAQNSYTQQYLSQVKNLPEIRNQLTQLQRVDAYTPPVIAGGHYFFTKRLANENQASIYMRTGWTGEDIRLVDATKLSQDQNTSVTIADLSQDGTLLVYGVRQGGADEESYHVLNTVTKQEMPDVLPSARYNSVALSPDKAGLYYARFSHEGTIVYYHRFGAAVADDTMIFGKEYRGETLGELALIAAEVTDDGHWLIVTISRGVPATREDILIHDLRKPGSDLTPLVYGVEAHTRAEEANDRFFMQTDYKSPNGRIVEVTAETGSSPQDPSDWKTLVPEGPDVIDGFSIAGGKLFVQHLHDVKTQTTMYTMAGARVSDLTYPGIGTGSVVYGKALQPEAFYTFQSFITPLTIYRYNVATGVTDTFFAPKVPFDSSKYEITQVFYTSKDGTRVPMFIAGLKGLKRDGTARLLMTGYGGFDLPMLSQWNPEFAWWIEQGGYFALPNLRGGNEYGEPWHKAAMFEKKQNVFDDWFAAAQYLIDNHYTSPAHFAIRGRSNGGLLMGASITQKPELFGAIWCGYPLLDMLRYQHFEFGRLWTTEYGDADNAADYDYIAKYSPYQHVVPGTHYPAVMFFSGDNDTRVDPLHARKMTARVQAANGGDRPILLHYSLKGGHSSGVSLTQLVDDEADELGFLWNETSGKQ
jgi:prolyl oligopeptidase